MQRLHAASGAEVQRAADRRADRRARQRQRCRSDPEDVSRREWSGTGVAAEVGHHPPRRPAVVGVRPHLDPSAHASPSRSSSAGRIEAGTDVSRIAPGTGAPSRDNRTSVASRSPAGRAYAMPARSPRSSAERPVGPSSSCTASTVNRSAHPAIALSRAGRAGGGHPLILPVGWEGRTEAIRPLTPECHNGVMRRGHDQPTVITSARESNDDEFDRRRKKYAIMMSLRALAVIGAAPPPRRRWRSRSVHRCRVVLPWCAVLVANDRPARKRRSGCPCRGPARARDHRRARPGHRRLTAATPRWQMAGMTDDVLENPATVDADTDEATTSSTTSTSRRSPRAPSWAPWCAPSAGRCSR